MDCPAALRDPLLDHWGVGGVVSQVLSGRGMLEFPRLKAQADGITSLSLPLSLSLSLCVFLLFWTGFHAASLAGQ